MDSESEAAYAAASAEDGGVGKVSSAIGTNFHRLNSFLLHQLIGPNNLSYCNLINGNVIYCNCKCNVMVSGNRNFISRLIYKNIY